MGRRLKPDRPEVPAADLERRRRNLARKIRLTSPELVRETIPLTLADEFGLGDLWRERVGR